MLVFPLLNSLFSLLFVTQPESITPEAVLVSNLPFLSQPFLQPFWPIQFPPHHQLPRWQRVSQEEPSPVPDALQEFARRQVGATGQ